MRVDAKLALVGVFVSAGGFLGGAVATANELPDATAAAEQPVAVHTQPGQTGNPTEVLGCSNWVDPWTGVLPNWGADQFDNWCYSGPSNPGTPQQGGQDGGGGTIEENDSPEPGAFT